MSTHPRVALPEWLSRTVALQAARPPWPEMIRAVVTVMAPLLVGLAVGHLAFALFVGIAAARVSVGQGGTVARRVERVGGGTIFAIAGFTLGRLFGGDGAWPVLVLAGLGLVTALMSSGGSSATFAGGQLIIFASVSGGLPQSTPLAIAVVALAVGGAWALTTSLAQALVTGTSTKPSAARTAASTTPTATRTARRARPRLRSLLEPPTRNYAARLAVALATADVVRQLVPLDNAYWVLLTVAVVLKPDAEPLVRGMQRALGTLVGAAIGIGILALDPGTAWLLVAVTVLAASLPYCIARSYGLYATFLTPFVLLLLDLPRPITSGLIVGRIADTALGAGVVIVAGYLIWPSAWRRNARRGISSTDIQVAPS